MSTSRLLNPKSKVARDRRREAIGFFRTQERDVNMPFAARHVAGYLARGLEAIQATGTMSGPEKDRAFKWFIQRTRKHGIPAR